MGTDANELKYKMHSVIINLAIISNLYEASSQNE